MEGVHSAWALCDQAITPHVAESASRVRGIQFTLSVWLHPYPASYRQSHGPRGCARACLYRSSLGTAFLWYSTGWAASRCGHETLDLTPLHARWHWHAGSGQGSFRTCATVYGVRHHAIDNRHAVQGTKMCNRPGYDKQCDPSSQLRASLWRSGALGCVTITLIGSPGHSASRPTGVQVVGTRIGHQDDTGSSGYLHPHHSCP